MFSQQQQRLERNLSISFNEKDQREPIQFEDVDLLMQLSPARNEEEKLLMQLSSVTAVRQDETLLDALNRILGENRKLEETVKELSNSKKEVRNKNSCSEHKNKHQKCPSDCPNRKKISKRRKH